MKSSEILVAAKALIEKPSNWTQKACARDYNGLEVAPLSSEACSWCILGAVRKVTSDTNNEKVYEKVYENLYPFINEVLISEFNDRHSHSEILAVFDKGIAMALAHED